MAIDRVEDLATENFVRHRGQIHRDLEDLLEVVTTAYSLLAQGGLDPSAIEGKHVDDVREAGGQSDELKDVANLRRHEAVNVVEHDHDRPLQGTEGGFELGAATAGALLATLQELAQDLCAPTATLDPGANDWQPAQTRERFAVIGEIARDLGQSRPHLELGSHLGEERLHELLGAAEHPRVELQYGDARAGEFRASQVHKGSLARSPRTEHRHHQTL